MSVVPFGAVLGVVRASSGRQWAADGAAVKTNKGRTGYPVQPLWKGRH